MSYKTLEYNFPRFISCYHSIDLLKAKAYLYLLFKRINYFLKKLPKKNNNNNYQANEQLAATFPPGLFNGIRLTVTNLHF